MLKAFADRLIDICARDAEQMAQRWHENLIGNPRTASYRLIPAETCQRHACYIYKNLGKMYFAENCYQAMMHTLDVVGFAEDNFARGIPLEEAIYALVLMRRAIWLHSEQQSLYNTGEDMIELIQSINRILVLFDYATHIVATKYREMSGKTVKLYR